MYLGHYTCIASNIAGTDTAEIDLIVNDENECETGMNKCKQICYNTIGSYYCGCYQGYYLLEDQYTCEGKETHTET